MSCCYAAGGSMPSAVGMLHLADPQALHCMHSHHQLPARSLQLLWPCSQGMTQQCETGMGPARRGCRSKAWS